MRQSPLTLQEGGGACKSILDEALDFCENLQKRAAESEFLRINEIMKEISYVQDNFVPTLAMPSVEVTNKKVKDKPHHGDAKGCLIEFCTEEDSTLGKIGDTYDIGVLRLAMNFGNCADDRFISDLISQMKSAPKTDHVGLAAMHCMVHLAKHVSALVR